MHLLRLILCTTAFGVLFVFTVAAQSLDMHKIETQISNLEARSINNLLNIARIEERLDAVRNDTKEVRGQVEKIDMKLWGIMGSLMLLLLETAARIYQARKK